MAVEDLMRHLDSRLTSERHRLATYEQYLEGEQPLRYMAPALAKELGDRVTQVVLNWPRVVADAYENRLDVEDFRYAGDDSGDDGLREVWQANDLDEQSQQGHLDSLALSRAYVVVGSADSDDDPPIVSVESPMQVWAERDPRTRRVSSALKRWDVIEPGGRVMERRATLYLPDATSGWVWGRNGWQVTGVDAHELGRVPVVPLVNRPRLLRPDGVSEFHDIIPIADAANKMATDMMVSGEFHAMPRRWAFGLDERDFKDESGKQLSTWSAIAGRIWSSKNKDVNVGQFNEADLAVFHNTIKLLAALTSQIGALPPHYMAFGGSGGGDNPTSADSIRASETQLVKRVERKHTFLGGAWEEAMRLVLRFQTGEWDPRARSLETVWRDPSTPTVAQKADATLKLVQARDPQGRSVLPLEQARIDLGYNSEQRRRMSEMDQDAASSDPVLTRLDGLRSGGAGAPVGG